MDPLAHCPPPAQAPIASPGAIPYQPVSLFRTTACLLLAALNGSPRSANSRFLFCQHCRPPVTKQSPASTPPQLCCSSSSSSSLSSSFALSVVCFQSCAAACLPTPLLFAAVLSPFPPSGWFLSAALLPPFIVAFFFSLLRTPIPGYHISSCSSRPASFVPSFSSSFAPTAGLGLDPFSARSNNSPPRASQFFLFSAAQQSIRVIRLT